MTVYRLAQLAGIRSQTIYRYVYGEREPILRHAILIMKAMGKSLAEIEDCYGD